MKELQTCPQNHEQEEEAQAQIDIWKYVFGFTEMAVVKCAIELGIADVIERHEGPMKLDDLSSSLNCSPSALYRIMRFLTRRRIFKEVNAGIYVQTPLSRRFMRNGEKSMADFVLLESSRVMLEPWHGLRGRVLADGAPAFDAVHNDDVWKYAERNPAHSKLINDAMACDSRLAVSAIVEGCSEVFNGINSLVDVGGGNGTTMGNLVKAFPWIKGINFDLPHVVSEAPNQPGVEHVGGDMFKSVPKADAAFIMWVLHDWGDEECIKILKNCKKAIPEKTGKVIIIEAVIDDGDEEEDNNSNNKLKDVGLMLDMVMMAHTSTGKERSCKEWDYVLKEAGFIRHTIKQIPTVQSVIEAYPY
ncbi:hypothetical protein M9H77_33769 [Catharanthus roseus]|uniref:Uncharacterized protein n=1 Tax=Catharanthus roseus TaxID=4058 RepID=A0ACB9ZJD2_CATRO|nr:hypothetical protein M9H77_33769 [Catharanthus roseus]